MNKRIGMLVLGLLLCSAVNTVSALTSIGEPSCSEWTEWHTEKKQNNMISVMQSRWLVGYMSGMARITDKDILKDADPNALYLWMNNYCKANPKKRVDDGGLDLYQELMKQKGIN